MMKIQRVILLILCIHFFCLNCSLASEGRWTDDSKQEVVTKIAQIVNTNGPNRACRWFLGARWDDVSYGTEVGEAAVRKILEEAREERPDSMGCRPGCPNAWSLLGIALYEGFIEPSFPEEVSKFLVAGHYLETQSGPEDLSLVYTLMGRYLGINDLAPESLDDAESIDQLQRFLDSKK